MKVCLITYTQTVFLILSFSGIDTLTTNAFDNILRIVDACHFMHSIDEKMEKVAIENHLSILNCEKSLLNFASSGETNGIFYAVTFELVTTNTFVARYMEHGCYSGFFR